MNSIRCLSCGLVNFTASAPCRRCGVFIQEPLPAARKVTQAAATHAQPPPVAQPVSHTGVNHNARSQGQPLAAHLASSQPPARSQATPDHAAPAYPSIAPSQARAGINATAPFPPAGRNLPPVQPQSNKAPVQALKIIGAVIL